VRLRDFVSQYHPEIYKYLILSVHYRSVSDFGDAAIEKSIRELARIYSCLALAVENLKQLPATPIVGHVLIRPALHSIEGLSQELQGTHAHKRSIIVPIAIPAEFSRYLSSGQRRSSGPAGRRDRLASSAGQLIASCNEMLNTTIA
jgi:cysteinyl-tRNA synthetase